jgi:hypothetical protein
MVPSNLDYLFPVFHSRRNITPDDENWSDIRNVALKENQDIGQCTRVITTVTVTHCRQKVW